MIPELNSFFFGDADETDSLRENADGRGFYFNCVIIYDSLCSVFLATNYTNYTRIARGFGTLMKLIHFVKTLMVADFILIVLLYMLRFAQIFLEHRLDRFNRFSQILLALLVVFYHVRNVRAFKTRFAR